jgi:hypothetical protein
MHINFDVVVYFFWKWFENDLQFVLYFIWTVGSPDAGFLVISRIFMHKISNLIIVDEADGDLCLFEHL